MPIMRTALIALSKNKALQELIVRVPISRRMARRFVAGETLDEALAAVKSLNGQGMLATLDHLGENVANQAEALAAADEYLAALDALYLAKTTSNVSVKLTQMGLDLGDDFCFANVSRIVARAGELGSFVRIDMEGSPYTERTLGLYRRLRQHHGNVGIVVQAALHRTRTDVDALIREGIGHFRLCKGAYDEPAAIAYRERPRVDPGLQQPGPRLPVARGPRQGRLPRHRLARRRGDQLRRGPTPIGRNPARRTSSSRCSTASAASCKPAWCSRATGCASTCPTARTGTPTSCAAWPNGRPICCSSCAPW